LWAFGLIMWLRRPPDARSIAAPLNRSGRPCGRRLFTFDSNERLSGFLMTSRSRSGGRDKSRATGAPQPRGRPTLYSRKLAQAICDKLADGLPIAHICRSGEDMPDRGTVRRWERRNAEFRRMITASREAGADALCDLVLPIANAATPATVNVARLKFDAIRWLVSKISPRKYGDKITAQVEFPSVDEFLKGYRAR
jgi:hypothetical protein